MKRKNLKALFIGLSLTVCSCTIISAQTAQEGLRALENERYEKAAEIFRNLIKSNPSNADYYYYLGDSYIELSKMDSAKILYNKGVTADAKNPLNYVGLGKIALEADNSQEFQKHFEKAISLTGPKDVRTHVLIANAYTNSSNKKPNLAIEVLNKAMERDNKNPDIYIAMGDAYLEQANGGKAVSNYEKAQQLNKDNPRAYVRIGQIYSRARNYTEALTAYQNALKIDSSYAPAYRELGELYYQAKKFDKAVETYKKYAEMAGNSLSAKSRYASFLFLNKEYAKSTELINEVMKKDSSNVIMKRLLGYSFYEQKEYDKALKYMQGFFSKIDKKKIIPSDYEYYGKILSKLNKDSLAIETYKKGLEVDNSKLDLYSEIAGSYVKLKNYPEAIKWYQNKINASQKPSPTDIFFLARAYYYNESYPQADSLFAKLTETQPKWPTGYVWRGRANSAMDTAEPKTYAAKQYYEKVVELGSADPVKNKADLLEAYKYLGFYYIQTDDKANAKQTYQKILEIDPENKEAKEILKGLK